MWSCVSLCIVVHVWTQTWFIISFLYAAFGFLLRRVSACSVVWCVNFFSHNFFFHNRNRKKFGKKKSFFFVLGSLVPLNPQVRGWLCPHITCRDSSPRPRILLDWIPLANWLAVIPEKSLLTNDTREKSGSQKSQFTKNVEYKCDHVSKNKNCKTDFAVLRTLRIFWEKKWPFLVIYFLKFSKKSENKIDHFSKYKNRKYRKIVFFIAHLFGP